MIGAYGIAYVAKKGVNRHRPVWDAAHTISTESGASFPSGHATGTSTLATVLILAAVPLLAGLAARRAAIAVLVAVRDRHRGVAPDTRRPLPDRRTGRRRFGHRVDTVVRFCAASLAGPAVRRLTRLGEPAAHA